MYLTDAQRELILEWIAAGAKKWPEIKAKAAAEDSPFDVSYPQFKGLRKAAGVEVAKIRQEGKKAATTRGYALIENQISLLKRLVAKHLSLIEDRAEEMEEEIAGGETGLLVRDLKGTFDRPVYKYDAAVIREIRELLKQIAILQGFWTEKKELTGAGGESLLDPLVAAFNKAYGNGKEPTAPTN